MSVSLPTHITISPEVLFQELDGESVLLNLQNDHYYGLDDVGTRMWQLLTEHSDTKAVLAQLVAEYDVGEATLSKDLAELIKKLADAGLLTAESRTSSGTKEEAKSS